MRIVKRQKGYSNDQLMTFQYTIEQNKVLWVVSRNVCVIHVPFFLLPSLPSPFSFYY